jgi:hypothetical protein
MKIAKLITSIVAIGAFSLVININVSASTTDVKSKCQYNSSEKVNPDLQTLNCLLTETALKYDVPPEIAKAIAEKESGNWKQFEADGQAVVTEDNGIGVMQITNQTGYDAERLKNDLVYNIEAGVQILDRMFERSDLPTINNGERDVLEHWYFAIMAYNGTKPVNSPIIQETGKKNPNAYQEKVYENIKKYGLIDTSDLPFSGDDFDYDSNSTNNIGFKTKNYHFNIPFTKSKHKFTEGQKVQTTSDVTLRALPTTGSDSKMTLKAGEIVTITGSLEYDSNSTKKNHFVWYPVKRIDGTTGYVASSYLKLRFKDVPAGHYAEEEIEYLVDREILKGTGSNQFGLGDGLKRWQAVLLLTRAQNISLANRPDPGFVDVPTTYKYYQDIAAAVDVGLFKGVSKDKFRPNKILTRAEMAEVLQRIYQFPDTHFSHPFTDVKANAWYAEPIGKLYASGITGGVTATKFGPKEIVTREQFAAFMVRSMDEDFRLR